MKFFDFKNSVRRLNFSSCFQYISFYLFLWFFLLLLFFFSYFFNNRYQLQSVLVKFTCYRLNRTLSWSIRLLFNFPWPLTYSHCKRISTCICVYVKMRLVLRQMVLHGHNNACDRITATHFVHTQLFVFFYYNWKTNIWRCLYIFGKFPWASRSQEVAVAC